MNRLWMSGVAVAIAVTMASASAQTPQTPPQNPPQAQPPATAQQPSAMQGAEKTLQGCVYKEADIPGRTPNVAEKAGVMEDYILVTAESASATAGTTGTTPPGAAPPATGAVMAGKAFKLEKIADERLKAVVGKRVEVTGRVDEGASGTAGVKPDRNPVSPDKIELPEFEVTALKEVEGTCPTTPQIKK